jgi:hypothetical protein
LYSNTDIIRKNAGIRQAAQWVGIPHSLLDKQAFSGADSWEGKSLTGEKIEGNWENRGLLLLPVLLITKVINVCFKIF